MTEQEKQKLVRGAFVLLMIGSLLLVVLTLNQLRAWSYIGRSAAEPSLIRVSGKGEVFAIPDIATFTYSVVEEASTVSEAQGKATEKSNKAVKYLRDQDVAEKDIRTVAYEVHPEYEYSNALCREGYCPPGKQTLVGYRVNQTVEVKVRKLDKAGDLLAGLGGIEVSNLSGLQFDVDDRDKIIEEARRKAITDAKKHAKTLAEDLDVRLVRIVSFEESGSYPPVFYKAYDMAERGGGLGQAAPELPPGETKVLANVTVVYEIR